MSDPSLPDKLLLKLHLKLDRLGIRERLLQKGYLSPLEVKGKMVHPGGYRPPGKLAVQFWAQARKGAYAPPPGRPEPPSIPFEKQRGEAASAHDERVLVGTRAVGKSELDNIEQESPDLTKWQNVHVLTAVGECDKALSELEPSVRNNTASRLEQEDFWYYSAYRDQLDYWCHDVFVEPLPDVVVTEGQSPSDNDLLNRELKIRNKKILEQRGTIRALRTMKGIPTRSEMKELMDSTRKQNGKANWAKLGGLLGKDGQTAKRYVEKLGLMNYAESD